MPDFRFIHAADLHLDSPLRGLEADASAPVELIRGATRRALVSMVDLALAEAVAFVVIAGDVYDGDWPHYGTGLFFAAQMRRLAEAAIPVFLIRGNHDAANRMTRSLRMPDLVSMFDHAAAHTHRLESLGVALHGQSFADQAVAHDLSAAYPPAVAGLFNIGILHTSASGHAAHETYAPCELERLRTHGYDYWALGHIHTRDVLSRDPWIVFPGNIQGRHINEHGPKGVSLVSVSGSRVQSVEARVLDDLRWVAIEIDLTGAPDEAAALARVQTALGTAHREAGLRHLAARVTLTGSTAAHAALSGEGIRDKVLNEVQALAGEHNIWLEKLRLRTSPPCDAVGPGASSDHLGRLLGEIDTLALSPPPDLLGSWPGLLREKLGRALPGEHALLEDPLAAVIERARHLLATALAGAG